MAELSKPPMDISSRFPLKIFCQLLFTPTVITTSGNYNVQQLPLIVFDKRQSGKRLFIHWENSESGQIKTSFATEIGQGTTR